MGKRKVFIKSDLSASRVEHNHSQNNEVTIPIDVISPNDSHVNLGYSSGAIRRFSFGRWYKVGIDPITYACQRQIERFLDKQDLEVTPTTIRKYCSALSGFLDYLIVLSVALRRELTLNDIDRELMDGYLGYLRDQGTSALTQKSNYCATKTVLKALCQRKIIYEVTAGDNATFPRNPFPNAHKQVKGEAPLSTSQRNAFSIAVKTAVAPIFSNEVHVTSKLLSYAFLVVALHTGRNTTPLLEMTRECLRSHPKENILFLVLYKRRGHSTSKVALRASRDHGLKIESMPTVRPTVVQLINRVIELSDRLRHEAPPHIKESIWLYRNRSTALGRENYHTVNALNESALSSAIRSLVEDYKLVDTDGEPLQINVSRLRKTFINRVYEILGGDVAGASAAAGNSPSVTATSYLRPGTDSRKNWKFMGASLVRELITNTLGATERTPVGQCTDKKFGDYAPKRDDAICMSFHNCVRCKNYVVTGDDLHRLFSYYWRLLRERARMPAPRWHRQYAHIIRLIDQDVIEAGILAGVFKRADVDQERERARLAPHPFWQADTVLADLAGIDL